MGNKDLFNLIDNLFRINYFKKQTLVKHRAKERLSGASVVSQKTKLSYFFHWYWFYTLIIDFYYRQIDIDHSEFWHLKYFLIKMFVVIPVLSEFCFSLLWDFTANFSDFTTSRSYLLSAKVWSAEVCSEFDSIFSCWENQVGTLSVWLYKCLYFRWPKLNRKKGTFCHWAREVHHWMSLLASLCGKSWSSF